MMYPPDLDAVGGRSYKQSSQTAGALGGRRDSVQWYKDGAVSTHNMIVKVAGAAWRLIKADVRVQVAPTLGTVEVDILAQMPGEASPVSVFNTLPSIAVGEYESSGGVFDPDRKILPIGTLVSQSIGGGGPVDLLVALGTDVSPREQSRLIGGVWDTPIAIPGVTKYHPEIMIINENLWFAINSDNLAGAWGWGVGARTKDGGDTWSATPDPGISGGGIKWVAADAGGRLWCIVHDTNSIYRRTSIYYSSTDGDSWTLSTTHGTGASPEQVDGWKIIPHPTDQDTIAIIGFSNGIPSVGQTRGFILITKNRGSSWTVNTEVSIRVGQASHWSYDAVMLSDGRIIAQGPFTASSPMHWYTLHSDTDGVTWSQGELHIGNLLRVNGLYVSSDENTIGYILTDLLDATNDRSKLWISTNKGGSFSEVNLAVEMQEFVGLSYLFDCSRFIASGPNEAMYVAVDVSGGIEVIKLSPVSAVGIVTDLTDAYPHSNQGTDNLGVVPGISPSGALGGNVELHYRTRAVSQ